MPILDGAVARLARTEAFDRPTAWLSQALSRVTHRPPVSTALAGTWLGHPLHPALTDVPIGFWTSAFVLDASRQAGVRRVSRFLIGAGVLSAVPTAVTGLADWADTGDDVRRIGTFHALANATGTGLYALSWLARRRGREGSGTALALAGATLLTAGASLGGHLVYRTGTGVDVNTFSEGPTDWTPLDGPPEPVADTDFAVLKAGPARVLARRSSGTAPAIGATCSHRGAPLEEGWFEDGCVRCPWHHSTFRLDNGAIVHGPATAPQPRYEVTDRDGQLAVRGAP